MDEHPSVRRRRASALRGCNPWPGSEIPETSSAASKTLIDAHFTYQSMIVAFSGNRYLYFHYYKKGPCSIGGGLLDKFDRLPAAIAEEAADRSWR